MFVDVGMSLDGFTAGPHGHPGNPLGDGGQRIHQWMFPLVGFRERVGLKGGETGRDDEIVKATFAPGAIHSPLVTHLTYRAAK